MKKLPFLLQFALSLILLLALGFILHRIVRDSAGLEPAGDLLLRSYAINAVLAFGIVLLLYSMRSRARYLIGFLFIGGSVVKFAVFFIFLYPSFQTDDVLTRSEFASFFVPYSLALILETYFASKMLRKLEETDQR